MESIDIKSTSAQFQAARDAAASGDWRTANKYVADITISLLPALSPELAPFLDQGVRRLEEARDFDHWRGLVRMLVGGCMVRGRDTLTRDERNGLQRLWAVMAWE
jgi:hypothetical protein